MFGSNILEVIKYHPIITEIEYEDYRISVLRLDLIHPEISGNKWFKLKYNLELAKQQNKNTIITFGGAYSNHIAATAFACKEQELKSIGIIRGESSSANNPTLSQAKKNGMELVFVSREDYKLKNEPDYLKELNKKYPNSFIIPEGGNNELGEKGCQEILTPELKQYDIIFCAYGTGNTFRGLTKSATPQQRVIGINVLKYKESAWGNQETNLIHNYHFGGYAKHTDELLEFKKWFELTYNIPLDYVYTSKLFFGVFDLLKNSCHAERIRSVTKNKKILIIHTGGLQGNKGYEERYNLNPTRHVNDIQG